MKRVKIPQTDSIEELAHFWDTHDLTEFEAAVTLHLQPQELTAVKQAAQARGIEEATLLREWVLEKLHGTGTAN